MLFSTLAICSQQIGLTSITPCRPQKSSRCHHVYGSRSWSNIWVDPSMSVNRKVTVPSGRSRKCGLDFICSDISNGYIQIKTPSQEIMGERCVEWNYSPYQFRQLIWHINRMVILVYRLFASSASVRWWTFFSQVIDQKFLTWSKKYYTIGKICFTKFSYYLNLQLSGGFFGGNRYQESNSKAALR